MTLSSNVEPQKMATPDQLLSWARTERYLAQVKALMAKLPSLALASALTEVDEFLIHNELGIASDWLRSLAKESYWQSVEVLKLLALAEASMGRQSHREMLDERLTQLLAEVHETKLPAA